MEGITDLEWAALRVQAHRAGEQVARYWPHCVSADDIEQDIMLRLLESPGSARKILDLPSEDNSQRKFLIKMGHQIASIEQRDYELYSGQYLYHLGEVRSLLEGQALTRRLDQHGITNQGAKFKAAEVDLRNALSVLADQYAEAIKRRYRDGKNPTANTERKTLSRAIEALTEHMNRSARNRTADYTDGPGTRRVLSNAQSIAVNTAAGKTLGGNDCE
ncbi:hypothetical protein [Kutzneria chonburiensis]|uniref:Uncharacterized protein n=1 Tax=Kutzneria chonburiensis TaxID=1483604 RepID=A0ABV6N3A3_9PSEU|nr:hypothetical protein [Kutzneria chonburiensis]